MLKKSASLLLCLALMTTMVLSVPCTAMASSAYSSDTSSVREVFHGFQLDSEEASYNDDLFKTDPREYNSQLAALSFALATASCNSRRIKDPSQYYKQMSNNVYEFLEDNGFSDIYVNKDYKVKPTDKTAGAIFAHKKIRDDGKDYTLLVIESKGGTIEAEYSPFMNISTKKGDRDDYAAFVPLRDKILASARQYINMYGIKGDIKVWTSGFSRSGGVANLLAAALIDDPHGYLGDSVNLTPDNLYCYAMSSIISAEDSKDLHAARYDSIHHIISRNDMILKSPTEKLCFGLYGQVHEFADLADKEDALRQMDARSHQTYEDFINNKDPDGFCPKKLDLKSLLKGELVLEDDDDSYLPYDQCEYLESVADNLTAVISGNDSSVNARDAYYEEYQGPLGRLIGTLGGFFDIGNADTSEVVSALTGNKLTVPFVLSLYLTFIADKSVRDGTTASAEINAAAESTFNALASQIEDENGHIRSEYKELRKMDRAYILFRNTYFTENTDEQEETDVPQKYSLRRKIKADERFLEIMRTLTARMYAPIMRDVLNVMGVDEDSIEVMTSEADSRAATYFMMHFLLGNDCQSKEIRPLDPNNEQLKNLATFIGNISSGYSLHLATYTVPWLRAGDSHFDDAQPLTEAQTSGYRRVYVSGQPGVDVSGTVRNGDGTEVASFRNGRITSRTESWIGITTYDSGYWLRLPMDEDYTVEFRVGSDSRLGLKLAEYSVAEGKVVGTVSWPEKDAYKNGSIVLNVPAAGDGERGYDLPSDVKYDVNVSGSASPVTPVPDGPTVKTVYSKSVPKAKAVKAKAGSKSLTVSWKKLRASQRKKFSKTEVQYSTSKKFKTYKTVDVSKNKKSVKIKGLKKGKTYYVRVRNVKKKDGIRYVSKWSAKKKVRVR